MTNMGVTALCLLLALSVSANAQTFRSWGMKMGVNQSVIRGGSDEFETKPMYGKTVGLYWRFDLDENIYVQPELTYSYKKTGIRRTDLVEWDRPLFHDLTIPILVGYEFNTSKLPPISILAGFAPMVHLHTGNGNRWGGERGSNIQTSELDWTLTLGSGLRIPFRAAFITVDGRIDFGRTPLFINDYDPVFKSGTFYLNTISISIGLPI